MIVKKIFIKKINSHLIKCPKWLLYLEDAFCFNCALLSQDHNDMIECKFVIKPEFQKRMEQKFDSTESELLQNELKEKITSQRLVNDIVNVIQNKQNSVKSKTKQNL
jgi:hypothetical protein